MSPAFGTPSTILQAVARSGDSAVGHELQRDRQIRARPLTEGGERLTPDVGRELLQQPGVDLPHAERTRHVEDSPLLLLLCLVAVGCRAPTREVLDFQDPHPVLLRECEHRGVIEAGRPVVLCSQPNAVESSAGGGAYPVAEPDIRAERVGADHERCRVEHA